MERVHEHAAHVVDRGHAHEAGRVDVASVTGELTDAREGRAGELDVRKGRRDLEVVVVGQARRDRIRVRADLTLGRETGARGLRQGHHHDRRVLQGCRVERDDVDRRTHARREAGVGARLVEAEADRVVAERVAGVGVRPRRGADDRLVDEPQLAVERIAVLVGVVGRHDRDAALAGEVHCFARSLVRGVDSREVSGVHDHRVVQRQTGPGVGHQLAAIAPERPVRRHRFRTRPRGAGHVAHDQERGPVVGGIEGHHQCIGRCREGRVRVSDRGLAAHGTCGDQRERQDAHSESSRYSHVSLSCSAGHSQGVTRPDRLCLTYRSGRVGQQPPPGDFHILFPVSREFIRCSIGVVPKAKTEEVSDFFRLRIKFSEDCRTSANLTRQSPSTL